MSARGFLRAVVVTLGSLVGAMLGLTSGMGVAELVVSAQPSLAEQDYIAIKVLVPFAGVALGVVGGGWAAVRLSHREGPSSQGTNARGD